MVMVTCLAVGDDLFGECDAPRDLVAVDGGESFSVGVTQAGDVVGWGSAFYGELGGPTDAENATTDRIRCRPVTIRMPVQCTFVACGLHHVLALSKDGDVYAWGRNAHGEIAQPLSITQSARPTMVCPSIPNDNKRFIALAAGGGHSLALQSTGVLWSWGGNSLGQLGIGVDSKCEVEPRRVHFPNDVVIASIAAGHAHNAALTRDGDVYTFGWGLYHQLGHGATNDCLSPQRVDALDGIDGGMRAIACGTWHTVALSSQGDVYSWGWGPDGQLGPNQGTSSAMPKVVDTDDRYFAQEDESHHAAHIACGARFTLVATRAGDVFCWGQQLRQMNEIMKHTNSSIVRNLASGHSHALLLTTT